MATRRLVIDANSGSPMRVSVGGVDAQGAQFDNLIFDANQPPLRVFMNGWVSVDWYPYPFAWTSRFMPYASWYWGYPLPPSPPGTSPLFLTMWYQPNFNTATYEGTTPFGTTPLLWSANWSFGQGAGMAVSDGYFVPFTFCKQIFTYGGFLVSWPDYTHIGFCIFRNAQ